METINTTDRFYQDWHDFEILGVPGRIMRNANGERRRKGLFDQQKWVSEWREYREGGQRLRIQAVVQLQDDCRNGHNTFHIMCDIQEARLDKWREYGGGSDHKAVAKRFPELASLTKWHGTSTDGPLHYIANTCYHAGNRDSSGLLKGEKRQIINGRTKQPSWHMVAVDAQGNEVQLYELPKSADGAEPPKLEYWFEWRAWFRTGEGKERDLDAARSCAVWPEATDEELMVERAELEAKLKERHPALMESFRREMELSAGLMWSVPDVV